MKNKTYLGGVLAIALLMIVGLACKGNGTKLEFNGGDLYYTDNVTEAEAKKLGEYLVQEKFYDGNPKSVQLDKSGSNYQFRMVVQKERQNDPAITELMKTFSKELSKDVFNGAPVEMHVCDDQLKTLRVVTP